MARAFIGVGSNIDRHDNIRAGIRAMQKQFTNVVSSSIYETRAVGFEGDNFFNLVIGLDTDLLPRELQGKLHEIENQFGRLRGESRFVSRTLDLDLLLYDDLVCDEEGMQLPRDDVVRFAFALRPLAEIAGELKHPVLAKCYSELWDAFEPSDEEMWPIEIEL